MTEEDKDGFRVAVLIRMPMLRTGAALAYALTETRRYFDDGQSPQPPLPDDPACFIPCTLLVTERYKVGTGERIGRIQFLRDGSENVILFDQEWTVANGQT